MSWLGVLNFLVLQWFFVRLAGVRDAKTGKQIGWKWLKGIVPLTGWWGSYYSVRIVKGQP